MNIKFFIRDLKIEGIQVVTVRLAKLLASQGHEVEIITLYEDQMIEDTDNLLVTSLTIGEGERSKSELENKFREWLSDNSQFDYLIASHRDTMDIIAKFNDDRLVAYIHSSDKPSYDKRDFIRKLKYRYKTIRRLRNKHILCVSDGVRDFIRKICGKRVLSVNTLYNTFDIESIKLDSLAYPFSADADDSDYILYVGRLAPEKRIDRLLKAYSAMNDQSKKLLILGSGDCESELKALVKSLNIEDKVVFRPFVTNPFPIMKRASLLALTSDFEGFSAVLAEALIVGTPVVSINCPSGPSEILTGNLSQLLVNSYDEEEFANVMSQILANSSKLDLKEGYTRFSNQEVYKQFKNIIAGWKTSD